MIYLDYSATTPVEEEVLDSFIQVTKNYIGNPNSLHRLGLDSKYLMEEAEKQVANLLKVKEKEVIFTSSASESNNLALSGIIRKYPKRNHLILTTKLEHSSTEETLHYFERLGYSIEYIKLQENGQIDLADFEEKLKKEPLLVTISQVNSEVGIIQPVEEMAKILKTHPLTFFHVDGTQAVGKIKVSLEGIDLYTFSAHKFFGLKGIACLIKKEKIELEPMIHGGKSQTIYRSGTPPLALIVSLAKALRLALERQEKNFEYVQCLNKRLRKGLQKDQRIVVNSKEDASPYILNISIPGIKPETMLHALEEKEVYLSTKTACSKKDGASNALAALHLEEKITTSSLRISLSYKTTEEEIDSFLKILNSCIDALYLQKEVS